MANTICEHKHLLFKDDKGGEIWTVTQSPDSPQINKAFVQGLIDSGELMVVKTVKFVSNDYDGNIDCDECGWSICYIHVEDNPMKFCPGCGAKIIS